MARILIVGNSCRARELAEGFAADGNAVRVTTRSERGAAQIAESGAQAVVCDPDRLATILPQMEGVTVIYWLLAHAQGNPADLHGPRLESVLEKTVDSGVRGFVYEARGEVAPALLDAGTALVKDASARWHIPVAVIDQDPIDRDAWLASARAGFMSIVNA